MILNFFTKVFGSSNDRILKKLSPLVQHINDLEPESKKLSDTDLAGKPRRSNNGPPTERRWMICCLKRSLWSGRHRSEPLACVILMSSSSAVLPCTRA